MLKRLCIRILQKKYAVRIEKRNNRYYCISVGQQVSAWTLPELKAKIEHMK